MTTIFPQEQTCAACGRTSTHHVLGSTNTMGPSDLDMRPAPMARWTLDQQVQCCPHCGCCAWDISEPTEAAGEIVANEATGPNSLASPFLSSHGGTCVPP